jgi:hypothetical protein
MVLRIKASSDAFFYAQTMPKLGFGFELLRRRSRGEVFNHSGSYRQRRRCETGVESRTGAVAVVSRWHT